MSNKNLPIERFVLYVGQGKDHDLPRGSSVALDSIRTFHEDVSVQNVHDLKQDKIAFPEWLDGTPCLVDRNSGDVYKGTACIEFLKSKEQGSGSQIVPGWDDEPIVEDAWQSQTEMTEDSLDALNSGKVNEQMLNAYMQKRNASLTPG